MQLPEELKNAIEELCSSLALSDLQKAREKVTAHYRAGASSHGLFHDPALLLSYLITRVPATFAACKFVLERLQIQPKTTLDLGAGPGTASWAIQDVFGKMDLQYLVERESEAIEIGKKLTQNTFLENSTWIQEDIFQKVKFPTVDLSILSFVIAETGVQKINWAALFAASSTIVVIEPGTPDGYKRILEVRKLLMDLGGFVIAPCPHQNPCPMKDGDWCHFAARVERTRLHRLLKEGSLGFEDEKFSYIAISKTPSQSKDRVIVAPKSGHGFIQLRLCKADGKLEEKRVTKKEKEAYKAAKKVSWGDVV